MLMKIRVYKTEGIDYTVCMIKAEPSTGRRSTPY